MGRSLTLAGVAFLSWSLVAQAGDHSWLDCFVQRTPMPCRPVAHDMARAGYPQSVSPHAIPGVTRFDNAGYVGGARLKGNCLRASGPGSATGPIHDGTFATDYTGLCQHMGRVFLAPSADPSRGRYFYAGYSAEGRRVTDVFALRPLRKAILEQHEDVEEGKCGKHRGCEAACGGAAGYGEGGQP